MKKRFFVVYADYTTEIIFSISARNALRIAKKHGHVIGGPYRLLDDGSIDYSYTE